MTAQSTRGKRKPTSNGRTASRKKQKRVVDSISDLPWKTVSRPSESGFEGDEGILDLEEVDDVEIVYEETENGRVAKFKVRIYSIALLCIIALPSTRFPTRR